MINLKLGEYLQQKGISVLWLSQKTGIRYATLNNMVHSKHKSISLEHMYKVMEALNINDMNIIFDKDGKHDNERKQA